MKIVALKTVSIVGGSIMFIALTIIDSLDLTSITGFSQPK
jgi:hypothetical protein